MKTLIRDSKSVIPDIRQHVYIPTQRVDKYFFYTLRGSPSWRGSRFLCRLFAVVQPLTDAARVP